MSPYGYGWEKLHLAMHALASAGDLKSRLVSAVVYNLIHITPENDLPPELREEFKQFMAEITSVPAKADEGTIQSTVATLDEMGLRRAVEKIISFYDRVCRHQEPY